MLSRRPASARHLAVALALALLAAGAAADESPTPTASYTLEFQSQWNPVNHPDDFPPGAHFSALIGALHDGSFVLWAPGGIATAGLEDMAETGGTLQLGAEIDAQIPGGGVAQRLNGPALFGVNGKVSMGFTASLTHPELSLVTMVAPSPDWFVGVDGLSLLQGGQWVTQLQVELLAWDAGTDSGATFLSPDADVTPHLSIALQSGTAPLGNLIPLGTFTLTRTDVFATWSDLGHALPGGAGTPQLTGTGALLAGETVGFELTGARPLAPSPVVLGLSLLEAPFKQGVLVPAPDKLFLALSTDATGGLQLALTWPEGIPPGLTLALQAWIEDPAGPAGWSASNGLCALTP